MAPLKRALLTGFGNIFQTPVWPSKLGSSFILHKSFSGFPPQCNPQSRIQDVKRKVHLLRSSIVSSGYERPRGDHPCKQSILWSVPLCKGGTGQPSQKRIHSWHPSTSLQPLAEANEPADFSHVKLAIPELKLKMRALADDLLQGQLGALSRAITVCESTRTDQRAQAAALLQYVTEHSSAVATHAMFRIGVTGPPGAGKSSLIERLGVRATENGKQVAVLAIDPSSQRSGGSILGDKTRMEELSRNPLAFVRPTPARGQAGGLARATGDAALLCEAAGCSVLLIETVGGGQSDTAVADMVDLVLLVLPPAGGDELQGIKKGVVEVADIVAVNKADGGLQDAAAMTVAEYSAALQFARPRSPAWSPPVMACSARTGSGMVELWQRIRAFERAMGSSGELQLRRAKQSQRLLWSNVNSELVDRFHKDERLRAALEQWERRVGEGSLASRAAAYGIVESFFQLPDRQTPLKSG